LITASILLLVIGFFRLSISPCFGLGSLHFPGMHPFLPDCLICWHIVAHNMFLKLYFLGIGHDLSPFIHDLINLGPFSGRLGGPVS